MPDILTSDTDFYISATGVDTNDGLSAAHPWPLSTLWQNLMRRIDLNYHAVTVHAARGHYLDGLYAAGELRGQAGAEGVRIIGDLTYGGGPCQTYIAPTSGVTLAFTDGAECTLDYLRLDSVNTGADILSVSRGAIVRLGYQDIAGQPAGPNDGYHFLFGNSGYNKHINANGGKVEIYKTYGILSGGESHVGAANGGHVHWVTNNAPNVMCVKLYYNATFQQFACSTDTGVLTCQNVPFVLDPAYQGSAIVIGGVRCLVGSNGVINTADPAFDFPGDAPGRVYVCSGGRYGDVGAPASSRGNLTVYA